MARAPMSELGVHGLYLKAHVRTGELIQSRE